MTWVQGLQIVKSWDLKLGVSPTLKTYPIIDIYYILIFKVVINGVFIVPLMMTVPITLGTVAIHEQQRITVPFPPVTYDAVELEEDIDWYNDEEEGASGVQNDLQDYLSM